MKFATEPMSYYPPQLRYVATLNREKLRIKTFCR